MTVVLGVMLLVFAFFLVISTGGLSIGGLVIACIFAFVGGCAIGTGFLE